MSLINDVGNEHELQNKLHTFFIEKTGGKVYKYRFFDKDGYSLSNLRNNTLYCSLPSTFNDPFDCKLGLDIQSLMAAKSGIEIDYIGEIFEHFMLVYNGIAKITDYPVTEQNVIQKWLDCESLNSIFQNSTSVNSSQELSELLAKNPTCIIDILQGAATDPQMSHALRSNKKMLTKMLGEQLMNIDIDSQNLQLDLNTIYKTAYDADEIEIAAFIGDKYHPEEHDNILKMQEVFNEINIGLKEKFENQFLIGCLAENYKNRLMWSHYADSHKGFCVEYDYSGQTFIDITPFPVCYCEDRIMVPWKVILDNNKENMNIATKQLMLALLTKDSIWAYENEWRILIQQSDEQNLKMPPISCIYIGAMCEEQNKKKLIEIAKELNIPIKQMTIDRGKYLLHANEIKLKKLKSKIFLSL